MIGMYPDAPALWWTQTTFGTIVLCLFFLTWGLVIINLMLWTFVLVRKVLGESRKTPKK